ncbi:putative GNAT family acetyltransferase [Cryphonectria parasitica EP155]|uniref:GNAT family acetyltransferase n=1 Tax=Cryphonectria parasitica (strain ATCC 38755 / EP155) TaxID=660469 RepID=A0A9P5CGZ0_CRYP1|nr:putative GNAT family acetyltransferase [Cryphonectria parasitica EP155]KAF3759919.1 putative GNAT family acetyltransferase [Cryphonectria parasitica EP155]
MASRLDNPPSDLPAGYTLHAGFPSVSEYRNLRKSSGLTPVTEAQAAGAVTGSLYGCHITYSSGSDQAVAMGRIIGDGGWYFHIADMATLPEHQRKGLGSVVLKHLLAYVKDNSPEDGEPYITLFADPPGRRLYERNGFVESRKTRKRE